MKFWYDKEFEEFLTYTEDNKAAIFPISKSTCSLWHSGIHLTDIFKQFICSKFSK